jgi:hypothetical protein
MELTEQTHLKLRQIEEQLDLALRHYPERIALERIKFALALTRFIRMQNDLDSEATLPNPSAPRVASLNKPGE